MPLTKTDIENRVIQRVLLIFGNDFDTYLDNALNAKIDELIKESLDSSLDTIVRNVMSQLPQLQNKIRNSTKIL